jgi:hypothetical protein
MKIINKYSKIENQEVEVDIIMIILHKIQAKEKSDMFKSREILLKMPNLIKKDISRLQRVAINNRSLISLIVVGKIEVDTNTVVVMKVVVVVIMIIIVTTNKNMTHAK